jgi:hypothetical protein
VTDSNEVTTRYWRLDEKTLAQTEVVRDLPDDATLIRGEDDQGGAEFLSESGEGFDMSDD